LRCEVCGHKIHGKPYKVIIEGAKLTVCDDCSKHGRLTWEEEPKPKAVIKPKGPKPTLMVQSRVQQTTPLEATLELVDDFDARIRKAREKLGISHEELGKKLNEKVSLLKKIETRKMIPDNTLATKLEHALKIKLMRPTSEEKYSISQEKNTKPIKRELTLGDLINLEKQDKKDKEETAGRERS
jgi:putative transcription factor